MPRSLLEYVMALGYWGFVVLGAAVLGVGGGYLDIAGTEAAPIARWVWIASAICVGIVAPFLAFHRVRIKNVELASQIDEREKNAEIVRMFTAFVIEGDFIHHEVDRPNPMPASAANLNKWLGELRNAVVEHCPGYEIELPLVPPANWHSINLLEAVAQQATDAARKIVHDFRDKT